MLTPSSRKRKILSGIALAVLVLVACVSSSLCLLQYWRGQTERNLMGYLARIGQVPATYEAIEVFFRCEFPEGLTGEEVLSKLNARFLYIREGSSFDGRNGDLNIAFPTEECRNDEEFRQGRCLRVRYVFAFVDGHLKYIRLTS